MQQPRRDSQAVQPWVLAAAAVFTALLCVFTISASSLVARALTPSLGDIVRFAPSGAGPATAARIVPAEILGSVPGGPTQRLCVLSSRAMDQNGGSLVVEARLTAAHAYKVHWAGGATSLGSTNCGSSAELLLNAKDLSALIWASNPSPPQAGMTEAAAAE